MIFLVTIICSIDVLISPSRSTQRFVIDSQMRGTIYIDHRVFTLNHFIMLSGHSDGIFHFVFCYVSVVDLTLTKKKDTP